MALAPALDGDGIAERCIGVSPAISLVTVRVPMCVTFDGYGQGDARGRSICGQRVARGGTTRECTQVKRTYVRQKVPTKMAEIGPSLASRQRHSDANSSTTLPVCDTSAMQRGLDPRRVTPLVAGLLSHNCFFVTSPHRGFTPLY